MNRYAIVVNNKVVNNIESDELFAQNLATDLGGTAHFDGGNIGDIFDGINFTTPAILPEQSIKPIRIISKDDFIDRLMPNEIGLVASSTDNIIKGFWKILEIRNGNINLDSAKLKSGLNYLSSPTGGSIFTAKRINEIIA